MKVLFDRLCSGSLRKTRKVRTHNISEVRMKERTQVDKQVLKSYKTRTLTKMIVNYTSRGVKKM
jgi:hypothetical protein